MIPGMFILIWSFLYKNAMFILIKTDYWRALAFTCMYMRVPACIYSNRCLSVSFFQPIWLRRSLPLLIALHRSISQELRTKPKYLMMYFSVSCSFSSGLYPAYSHFSSLLTYLKIYYYLGDPTFLYTPSKTTSMAMWANAWHLGGQGACGNCWLCENTDFPLSVPHSVKRNTYLFVHSPPRIM